jgi:hypothetical protein
VNKCWSVKGNAKLFFKVHLLLASKLSTVYHVVWPGVAQWLRHCATSRKVPRSIPVTSDRSMHPGVDSASKNEYQVNAGGKGGRCVRLTT